MSPSLNAAPPSGIPPKDRRQASETQRIEDSQASAVTAAGSDPDPERKLTFANFLSRVLHRQIHPWPTEVSFDNACAPFLRQRFEKMAMEDDPTNGSREKKDRRRTPSLVDILSCSSKKNYPRGFGSQYLLYKICCLDANGQLEWLLTSRSSKRDGRSPTNSMTN